MRKNAVNRELRPVEGGVCAPEGYKANAVACGICEDGSLDFAMIFSEKRCAVACVYAATNNEGAPVKVTKKNMRNGYARAILVNSGVANVFSADGEQFAKWICDLLFQFGVERGETVIASTGEVGKPLEIEPYQRGILPLWQGLASSNEHSLKAAKAIMTEDSFVKQLSYEFDLGDYPCKIGVIFKGGPQISPNMATFLAFLTTDVNISTPLLQKALTAEVKETLNLLNLDGVSSPNDTVCILANGRAGNYKIDCEDSEYQKFRRALRAVLTEVCKLTAKDGAKKTFTCLVKGVRSKELARKLAKSIVGLEGVKASVLKGFLDVKSILYSLLEKATDIDVEQTQIILRSQSGEIVLYEDEYRFPVKVELIEKIIAGENVEIFLNLGAGNFQSRAYGRV